jgi:PmbA protein
MITSSQLDAARHALEFARKKGAQQVRVTLDVAQGAAFEFRDDALEALRRYDDTGLAIQLFVDGRFGSFASNRLHPDDLLPFIDNAISATRLLAPDPHRTLPDPSRYFHPTPSTPNLDTDDRRFNALTPQLKIDLARAAAAEATGHDPRILSVFAAFEDSRQASFVIDSNGFEAIHPADTSFSLSASVSLQDPNSPARPEDYWFHAATHFDQLQSQGIGHQALLRAQSKIGQTQAPSGKYPILLHNTVAPQLLSPLINALYGANIQQKNSFLLNMLGQPIADPLLSLYDQPLTPNAFGARLFDFEGVATTPNPIIHYGVLQTYFLDTTYAHKLNSPPTFSAPSILSLQPGNQSFDQLLASLHNGILISALNGGNANSSSGDFSYGFEGFLIRNGSIHQPLARMNITGNLLTLWNNLRLVGNDPLLTSSWRIPSLLFEDVDCAGL